MKPADVNREISTEMKVLREKLSKMESEIEKISEVLTPKKQELTPEIIGRLAHAFSEKDNKDS